jgi:hypothetical protein
MLLLGPQYVIIMSKLQLRIFDGTRNLFAAPAKFLVTITDGNQTQHVRDYFPENDITFDLPFFDNFGDNYTVIVWADGYKQAGFVPVKLSDQFLKIVDIMLIANNPGFSFADAKWEAVNSRYPFLGSDVEDAAGETRYNNLLEQSERTLACLGYGNDSGLCRAPHDPDHAEFRGMRSSLAGPSVLGHSGQFLLRMIRCSN